MTFYIRSLHVLGKAYFVVPCLALTGRDSFRSCEGWGSSGFLQCVVPIPQVGVQADAGCIPDDYKI